MDVAYVYLYALSIFGKTLIYSNRFNINTLMNYNMEKYV